MKSAMEDSIAAVSSVVNAIRIENWAAFRLATRRTSHTAGRHSCDCAGTAPIHRDPANPASAAVL